MYEELTKMGVELIAVGMSADADLGKLKKITTGGGRAKRSKEAKIIFPRAGEDVGAKVIRDALEKEMTDGERGPG